MSSKLNCILLSKIKSPKSTHTFLILMILIFTNNPFSKILIAIGNELCNKCPTMIIILTGWLPDIFASNYQDLKQSDIVPTVYRCTTFNERNIVALFQFRLKMFWIKLLFSNKYKEKQSLSYRSDRSWFMFLHFCINPLLDHEDT
jgi:hypothetical protein